MPVTVVDAKRDARVSPALSPSAAEVVITTSAPPADWDAFVRAEDASRYHLSGWRQVFEDTFGHETVYLAAQQQGEITGVLPLVVMRSRVFGRFAVSLPFVDTGGVCARHEHVARLLVQRAAEIAAGYRLSHVELRHVWQQRPDLPVRQHKVGMSLPLVASSSEAWAALDRKVRNQVRKAEKSGLTERRGGADYLDAFYEVFVRNMRDLGTPVYPLSFFRNVVAAFADSATVFLIEHGSTVVAAGIALVHGNTLAVPWASSLRDYRAQCPNNLLYWRIIEHAIASGMSTLDFGRSTPGEGTFQFKEQWGARPTPLNWEYVVTGNGPPPDLTTKNPKFQFAIAAWKKLPVPVTRWLGPRIVGSIP